MRKVYNLWNDTPPYFNRAYGEFVPSLTDWNLDNNKINSCVIVVPGGGYSSRSEEYEGSKICEFLNANGIAAFVLNYRISPYKHPCMEEDIKRAVRFVRFHSAEWNIDSSKISVIGFSAGGHLCCMSGLRFDYGKTDGDEIDRISSRPDLAAVCYPVASLDRKITHTDTRDCLLGENADDSTADSLSPEKIVPDDAPPFFIWHTQADDGVNYECSMRFALALGAKKIPYSLHIFPFGCHGLNLAENEPMANMWPQLYLDWLRYYGF